MSLRKRLQNAVCVGALLIAGGLFPASAQNTSQPNSASPGVEQAFTCSIPFLTTTGATTLHCFMKAARAYTVDNVMATASGTFTTITPTLYECGTSTTCASSPITLSGTAVTAANTATPQTVASSTINSGDYVAVEITAGTMTSGQLVVIAEMH